MFQNNKPTSIDNVIKENITDSFYLQYQTHSLRWRMMMLDVREQLLGKPPEGGSHLGVLPEEPPEG